MMGTLFWFEGRWLTENPKVIGPGDHGVWMASSVFDGARSFFGSAPDLDRHCARAIASALIMGMRPEMSGRQIERIAMEAIQRFPADSTLYIKPIFWVEAGTTPFSPGKTRFALQVFEIALPRNSLTASHSHFRRSLPSQAPVAAKSACHYPMIAMALADARLRGFETAVMQDPFGNVADFASSNLFSAKGGIVRTPAANGCFLDGITRQRIISLLTAAGTTVEEIVLSVTDIDDSDEVFSTGNIAIVQTVSRIENKFFTEGPITRLARELYFNWSGVPDPNRI